ncbi:MAG TPA: hypothetical protein VNB94_04805 [Mycobacteriales bacterium]|nr:hypothetical protein [Mycobacteriales bacterium]
MRRYDVVAIAVDITLNRYLDHDPQGRAFVLAADLPRARAEEARNDLARRTGTEPAVSAGLQGDAIQPLTLRVNQGECLRVSLRNDIPDEPASLIVHGVAWRLAGSRTPALSTTAAAVAAPGGTVDYEWYVSPREPEGTRYLNSSGAERSQTSHGLFGAVVVEPAGSTYLDPRTGAPLVSGWDAVIRAPDGKAFREFAIYYHEVGDETFQPDAGAGGKVPLVDDLTHAYKPSGRALNYRSEPFLNRMRLQQGRQGRFDESVAYSSYAFGDPATPVLRTYLGEPVKERVVHGGSEVFHVHHVHGGATRWRRQPGAGPTGLRSGVDKTPPLLPGVSERTDSQSVGPSETFDIEHECGAGGCQGSVGDFLYHCHVAQHYFAGMWGLWRVYNTAQDGPASTDALPPLAELPDRRGQVRAAVDSRGLPGIEVTVAGARSRLTETTVTSWVARQLPPPGVPRGYDAAVLDWGVAGGQVVGEPETKDRWPGYSPRAPGRRRPVLFDPITGKLAYPHLQPHLGRRPPFAPGHGPAPYLDPSGGPDLPAPGTSGDSSVCPAGTRRQSFGLRAITVPVPLHGKSNVVDPDGQLFVLAEQEAAVRRDGRLRTPLAIRANAGEDCLDLTLTSELVDSPENNGFAKVNAHVHFVQFDVQGSDGVTAGFNYEQSVRPWAVEGERLTAPLGVGATTVALTSAARFQAGVLVAVGVDEDQDFEVARVVAVVGSTITLDRPLRRAHPAGTAVTTEFVRYRWFPDVQFGTAFFHDHVNAVSSWRHGLFGALISEPPGSTYHDPRSGAPVRSGPVADVRTDAPVSVDVDGSFRELVLFVQDDNPLTRLGRSTGSSLNLRVEPLAARSRGAPSMTFSSTVHGDPETPVLDAYAGDPVVLRTLVGGTNDVHTVHVDGHQFRTELWNPVGPLVSTAHLGISERYDLVLPTAGGPAQRPGDYLFYIGRSFRLREGSWGLIRVRAGPAGAALQPLPGSTAPDDPVGDTCPTGATRRTFDVVAAPAPLPVLRGTPGAVFVLRRDLPALRSGAPVSPLVLHVGVGDCLVIDLANETTAPVSPHVDQLVGDAPSSGIATGDLPDQATAPGGSRSYSFYAHPRTGETVGMLRDGGDLGSGPGRGLYGAVVVSPAGAVFRDPGSGLVLDPPVGVSVVVEPVGRPAYRDFTLLLHDDDASLGTHRMPYRPRVDGRVGINYQVASLADRLRHDADSGAAYRSSVHGDPPTPLLQAFVGDDVRLHVLAPWSEQSQVFGVEGHHWRAEPGLAGSNQLSAVKLGGAEGVTMSLTAGGDDAMVGDFRYGNRRLPFTEAGMWGLLRVHPRGAAAPAVRPLPGAARTVLPGPALLGGLGLIVAASAGLALRGRRLRASGG